MAHKQCFHGRTRIITADDGLVEEWCVDCGAYLGLDRSSRMLIAARVVHWRERDTERRAEYAVLHG